MSFKHIRTLQRVLVLSGSLLWLSVNEMGYAQERQANLPQADSKQEQMGYLDNGIIRLGVNLSLGGAITYMAPKAKSDAGLTDGPNLVNNYDWGRQIQMSHYSGPNPFAPNGKQPNKNWAGLGWNPIQSGDCFGNRSRIIGYKNDGKTIYLKCVPMQWPLDNEPGECTFESWIQLGKAGSVTHKTGLKDGQEDGESNVAHVRCRLTNHRTDTTQYSGRSQELPAVYTNGPWYRLMTYTGDRPFTHDSVTQIPQVPPGASFPWSHWWGTEHWAALMDDSGFGLGIFEPDTCSFLGGFAGKPGRGGPKESPTGYIAPLQEEILDHNIVYEYRYDLILGTLNEIREYVYAQHQRDQLPSYRFARDRQHWRYVNATDAGWPIQDELRIRLDKPGVQLIGPSGVWKASAASTLVLEAAFSAEFSPEFFSKGESHTTSNDKEKKSRDAMVPLHIFWRRHDSPEFSEEKRQSFNVVVDGKYHTYKINLSKNPEYRGAILGLRLDPPSEDRCRTVRIRSIRVQ